MRKLNPARLLLPLALLFALAAAASAQAPVDTRGALATFPDSQAVLFVNAHRLVNDVLPRLMPPADYQKMLSESQKVGFDVRGLQFAAAGVRFNDSAPAGTPPDFVIVVKGNFNADSILALGRIAMAAQNMQSREETYGSKSIEIINTDPIAKQMGVGGAEGADGTGNGGKPKANPYPELAITALDSNTLVAGVPGFVRSAVDAAGGRGGLNAQMLGLASQDPNTIWGITAELPPNLVEMAHKYGVPPNAQFDQMVGWVKQLNISMGTTALDYTMSVAVMTDQPEHASAFSGLIRMGQAFAENAMREEASKKTGKDAAQARAALGVLTSAVNRTEGNTLILRVSVPQKTVVSLINEQRAKSKPANNVGRRPARRGARRRR
jgi:hypothetical protein